MRSSLAICLLLTLFVAGCKDKKHSSLVVKCPPVPAKGIVKLKLSQSRTIDSKSVNEKIPPLFRNSVVVPNGNTFISSMKPDIMISKFNPKGEFIEKIGTKGEGPGEFKNLPWLTVTENHLVVRSSSRIYLYDHNGKYISETSLKDNSYQRRMLDENRYVEKYYVVTKTNPKSEYVLGVFDNKKSKELTRLMTSKKKGVGSTVVNVGFTLDISLQRITPGFTYDMNLKNKLFYTCCTDVPEIYIKDFDGNIIKIIEREYNRAPLTAEEIKKQTEPFKKFNNKIPAALKKVLPDSLTCIENISSMPNGYFMVSFVKSMDELENCIFDKEGNFLYIIKFPETPVIYYRRFTPKGVAGVVSKDDRDFYVEYKITNLPEAFGK